MEVGSGPVGVMYMYETMAVCSLCEILDGCRDMFFAF